MVNHKYAKTMLKKASIKTWADIQKTKLKRIPCYVLGGFQLLDLFITELLKMQGLSLVEILFVKKNPLQDLLSSLNTVI